MLTNPKGGFQFDNSQPRYYPYQKDLQSSMQSIMARSSLMSSQRLQGYGRATPKPLQFNDGDRSMDVGNGSPKWIGRRLSKREVNQYREKRLSKILQPKGALMILNELHSDVQFTVEEVPEENGQGLLYKATVTVNGINHIGFGKNKAAAKNDASEQVLKVLCQGKNFLKENDDHLGTSGEGNEGVSWQQIASFALHKLFSIWGGSVPSFNEEAQTNELKPAKKIPDNAAALNPVMVLHQLHPNINFEEVSRTGTPPNILFNMKCTIEGRDFFGSGSSKKVAKKEIAFAICSEIFGIQYPPDVYKRD